MENYLPSFFLAFIQAATEFLPISSSGHLQVYRMLSGSPLEHNLIFDIVLHFATMLATLLYFRRELLKIIKGAFHDIQGWWIKNIDKKMLPAQSQPEDKKQYGIKYVMMIILASLPIGIVGVMWKDVLENFFSNNLTLVGAGFIWTTLLLLSTLFLKNKHQDNNLGWKLAMVVGLFQMIAIMPGVSRSGSCLVAALWLGANRRLAAEFAFIISLPAISGAMLLGMLDLLDKDIFIHWDRLFLEFITSLVLGWVFLTWLMRIFSKGKLYYFSIYTFLLGLYCLLSI